MASRRLAKVVTIPVSNRQFICSNQKSVSELADLISVLLKKKILNQCIWNEGVGKIRKRFPYILEKDKVPLKETTKNRDLFLKIFSNGSLIFRLARRVKLTLF